MIENPYKTLWHFWTVTNTQINGHRANQLTKKRHLTRIKFHGLISGTFHCSMTMVPLIFVSLSLSFPDGFRTKTKVFFLLVLVGFSVPLVIFRNRCFCILKRESVGHLKTIPCISLTKGQPTFYPSNVDYWWYKFLLMCTIDIPSLFTLKKRGHTRS